MTKFLTIPKSDQDRALEHLTFWLQRNQNMIQRFCVTDTQARQSYSISKEVFDSQTKGTFNKTDQGGWNWVRRLQALANSWENKDSYQKLNVSVVQRHEWDQIDKQTDWWFYKGWAKDEEIEDKKKAISLACWDRAINIINSYSFLDFVWEFNILNIKIKRKIRNIVFKRP